MTLQATPDIAEEVRGLLARRQLTQAAVAKALHLSTMQLSRRTTGRTNFTPEELRALAQFLDVPIGVLYGEPRALADLHASSDDSPVVPDETTDRAAVPSVGASEGDRVARPSEAIASSSSDVSGEAA